MTNLSENAENALAALRADTPSASEKERVRARLCTLGLVALGSSSVAAVSTSMASASSSGSAIATANVGSGAAASSAVSSGTLVGSGTAAPAAGTTLMASSGSGVLGAAQGAAAAKLGVASVLAGKALSAPVALKAVALVAALGGSVALPLTLETPRKSPSARELVSAHGNSAGPITTPAQSARARTATSPVTPGSDIPMELDVADRAPTGDQHANRDGADTTANTLTASPQNAPAPTAFSPRTAKLPAAVRSDAAGADKASSLAAESALLADALRALKAGELTHASALLDQHAQTFQSGQLAPERERLRTALIRLQAAHTVASPPQTAPMKAVEHDDRINPSVVEP